MAVLGVLQFIVLLVSLYYFILTADSYLGLVSLVVGIGLVGSVRFVLDQGQEDGKEDRHLSQEESGWD